MSVLEYLYNAYWFPCFFFLFQLIFNASILTGKKDQTFRKTNFQTQRHQDKHTKNRNYFSSNMSVMINLGESRQIQILDRHSQSTGAPITINLPADSNAPIQINCSVAARATSHPALLQTEPQPEPQPCYAHVGPRVPCSDTYSPTFPQPDSQPYFSHIGPRIPRPSLRVDSNVSNRDSIGDTNQSFPLCSNGTSLGTPEICEAPTSVRSLQVVKRRLQIQASPSPIEPRAPRNSPTGPYDQSVNYYSAGPEPFPTGVLAPQNTPYEQSPIEPRAPQNTLDKPSSAIELGAPQIASDEQSPTDCSASQNITDESQNHPFLHYYSTVFELEVLKVSTYSPFASSIHDQPSERPAMTSFEGEPHTSPSQSPLSTEQGGYILHPVFHDPESCTPLSIQRDPYILHPSLLNGEPCVLSSPSPISTQQRPYVLHPLPSVPNSPSAFNNSISPNFEAADVPSTAFQSTSDSYVATPFSFASVHQPSSSFPDP